MITWARFPFLRLTPALLAGIVVALALPETTPDLAPFALAVALLAAGLGFYLSRRRAAPTAAAGLAPALLLSVALLGAVRTQQVTESRRPDHLIHFAETIEAYRAVVDDYTVVRPATYATTLRVSEVRRAGRWQSAVGGIRISLPRVVGIAAPSYGQVYIIRGHPDRSKAPLNPGEFDYRRYLDYRQVYHQQYVHPDQYRIVGLAPPNVLVALSMRCARQLDAVFGTTSGRSASTPLPRPWCWALRMRWMPTPKAPTPPPALRTSWQCRACRWAWCSWRFRG